MDGIFGRVATALHLEPERVWMVEWADVARLYRYWGESPPVHELVAQAVGFKPRRGSEADRAARPSLELSAEEILRGFNAGTQTPIGVR